MARERRSTWSGDRFNDAEGSLAYAAAFAKYGRDLRQGAEAEAVAWLKGLPGKVREAADCYGHADGPDPKDTVESAKQWMARGFRHVRVQVGVPGMASF